MRRKKNLFNHKETHLSTGVYVIGLGVTDVSMKPEVDAWAYMSVSAETQYDAPKE